MVPTQNKKFELMLTRQLLYYLTIEELKVFGSPDVDPDR